MVEEESKGGKNFCSVFDANLFTTYLAGVYINFPDCMAVFPMLNKQFNLYMSPERDFIWKRFFESEFLRLEYPDHKKGDDENFF
jgi:hypothetical protein